MKKFIRGIYLGIFCLILLQPVHGIAEEASAKFGIQRDEAIFRIKNFEAASGEYRLLLFAEAKLAEKPVWVCIDERTYDTQELTENYLNGQGRIEDMPYAESVAVKLFAENGSAWVDCFGLCESRTHFSGDTYSVQVENGDADKETPELYVLIEDDSTILPLKMAEELYGFKEMPQKGSLVFIAPDGLFLDDPVVFICAEKDGNGILLKKYARGVSVR